MRATCATVRRARPLLGTLVEIRARGRGAEAAIERAFRAIERVHAAMSAQESTSDIARLRTGRRVGLDAWTREVLERAEQIRLATDGLFDCARCDYSLDGIAKGFAVDRAVDCLRDAGIEAGAVNAGGDLRLFGAELAPVYVRPPQTPTQLVHIGELQEIAVATSGTATLVSPVWGLGVPAPGVTVLAADCVTADALTKPCLLEPERAHGLAAPFGAQVIVHE